MRAGGRLKEEPKMSASQNVDRLLTGNTCDTMKNESV
jgi:hypothetical protein